MDEILEKYEIRKSNKQKTNFYSYLKERLCKNGYSENDIKIEERWKLFLKTRNIIVGNPKKAKVIVTAHYDTCAVSPLPNFMFPTNVLMFAISQLFTLAVVMFVALVAMVLFILYSGYPSYCIHVFQGVLILFLIQMSFGFKNKHAANDNTSGVISLVRILEKVPEAERKNICVVFFDNEEKGLFGSLFFKKLHEKDVQDKLLINIDCVGDGDRVLTLAKRKARKNANYEKLTNLFNKNQDNEDVIYLERKMKPMMFPSDQAYFDNGIAICSLKKTPIGLYAGRIHTPFDTKCRMENIEYISKSVVEFVSNI